MCWNSPVKAKVRGNQLVVWTKGAIEHGVWMREASLLQNANFRIERDRDGYVALRCVTVRSRGDEIDTVARFEKPEQADKALASISHALMCGKFVAPNDDEGEGKGRVRMPTWASVSTIVAFPAVVVLAVLFFTSGYAKIMDTLMEMYWGGGSSVPSIAATAMPSDSSAAQAFAAMAGGALPSASTTSSPAMPAVNPNATGQPVSADDFLKNLSQTPGGFQ